MKKFLVALLFVSSCAYAQTESNSIKKYESFEHATYTEMIFSFSQTEQDGKGIEDVLRWSPVFNFGHEFHFNLSERFGIQTGLGIRNIGFIDKPVYTPAGSITGTQVKMKHRVYALVLPLAVKLGNMGTRTYISAGAELNIFLQYKEKVWVNDSKTKKSEWFSDRVELFNPSFFGQINMEGSFIKFIVYPNNFIKQSNTTFAGDLPIANYPSNSSDLIAISLGSSFVEYKIKQKSSGSSTTSASARAMY